MSQLAFAARHISTTPQGLNTVFHFRDDNGNMLALLLDGEVGGDFVDHCRVYYEPETTSAFEKQIESAVVELFDLESIALDPNDPCEIADALDLELRKLIEAAETKR